MPAFQGNTLHQRQPARLRGTLVWAVLIWLALLAYSLLFPQRQVFVTTGEPFLTYQVYYFEHGFQEDGSRTLRFPDHLQGNDRFLSGVSFPSRKHPYVFRFDIDPRDEHPRFNITRPDPFTLLPVVVSHRGLLKTTQFWYDDPTILAERHGVVEENGQYRLTDDDAHFVVDLSRAPPHIVDKWHVWDLLISLLIIAGGAAAVNGFRQLHHGAPSPALFAFSSVMAVVIGFCLALNMTQGYGHGPDELMHFPSLSWYQWHLAPPSMGDPTYLNRVWKTSYILGASGDLPYLLTAKMQGLLSWVLPFLDAVPIARLAQVLIIVAGLGIAALLLGPAAAMAYLMAWLVVPQLSYSATYVNGDALSFAMGFIALGLAMLRAPQNGLWLIPALFLLLNLKTNYLVLVALLPLMWLCVPESRIRLRKRWGVALLVSLPVLLYRRIFNALDQAHHGKSYLQAAFDRLVADEDVSISPFKLAHDSYERRLAGAEAFDYSVLTDANWYEWSLRSLFGVFGYMDHPLPWAMILPSITVFLLVLWLGGGSMRRWLLLGGALALSVAASLYYSLSEGYQPQGRYLFPLLCVVFLMARKALLTHARLFALAALPTLLALSVFRPFNA